MKNKITIMSNKIKISLTLAICLLCLVTVYVTPSQGVTMPSTMRIDPAGGLPITLQSEIAGGYQVVATGRDLDLIPTSRLVEGMLCYVLDTKNTYRLVGNSWIVDAALSGGGGQWTLTGSDISNTNTGNVGIGTATPAEKLDVKGNISMSGQLLGPVGYNGQFGVGNFSIPNGTLYGFSKPGTAQLTIDYNTGDVGIGTGTTLPGAKLEVNGNIKLSGTAQADAGNEIYFADNGQIRSSDNYHRIIFNRNGAIGNDLELREYGSISFSPGSNPSFGRTAKVLMDSNGNVGIGTTTPAAPLNISSSVGGYMLQFDKTVTHITKYDLGISAANGDFILDDNTWPTGFRALTLQRGTGRVGIKTDNPANELTVSGNMDVTGNVGIGTNAPANPLEVFSTLPSLGITRTDSAKQNSGLVLATGPGANPSVDYELYTPAGTSDLHFYSGVGGGDKVTFASSGRVGIGTATPGENLTVYGPDAMVGIYNSNDSGLHGYLRDTYGTLYLGMMNSPNFYDRFAISGTSGAIGSVTNRAPGVPLFRNVLDDGSGNASFSGDISMDRAGGAGQLKGSFANGNTFAFGNFANPTGTTYGFSKPNAPQLSIDYNTGNVTVRSITLQNCGEAPGGTLTYNSNGDIFIVGASSRRFKRDIRNWMPDLANLDKLIPVKFKYNDKAPGGATNIDEIGLIAEDVYKLYPDLVTIDKEGKPFGIKYEKLSVVLLQAVKAQQKKISDLEARLAAIEQKLNK